MATKHRPVKRRRRLKNSVPVLLALIVVAVIAIYFAGGQNKLKSVVVAREGDPNSVSYISDDEIIRASGLKLGDSIGDLEAYEENAAKSISALGYVSLESLTRTGKHEITIRVNVRRALAVLNANGNYVLMDKQGNAMAYLDELPTYNIMYVDGVELTDHRVGRKVVTRRASQIDDIVSIVNAIDRLNYLEVFSQLNVRDAREMYLFTKTNLIVSFYTTDDIERTLELAMGIINEGNTSGKIIVSGDKASFIARETQVNSSD